MFPVCEVCLEEMLKLGININVINVVYQTFTV